MPISKQQIPHGGWEYLEEKTNTKFRAVTFDGVVKAVTAHRKANGINVGDVEWDVERQIEKNHPEISIN